MTRWCIGGVELEDGHQFNCGYAQINEIRNVFEQAGIGPRPFGRHARVRMPGKAADVHLVDYVSTNGRWRGWSPSQSYATGSATMLFIAEVVLLPTRLYVFGMATARP